MKQLVVAAAALTVVLAAPAAAQTRNDPDDVGGRLDLRRVTRTFTNGPAAPPMVHFQATTYDGWTAEECRRAKACDVRFVIDSRAGGGPDFALLWRSRRCDLFDYRRGTVVDRGDGAKFRRSVFCSIEKRVLDADPRPMRWRVGTTWGAALVTDGAPDRGWF